MLQQLDFLGCICNRGADQAGMTRLKMIKGRLFLLQRTTCIHENTGVDAEGERQQEGGCKKKR